MNSRALRERLGLSRNDWARALNVHERTVERWEDEDKDPGGLAIEVMRGIEDALAEGAHPAIVAGRICLGIGALLARELARQVPRR